MSTQCLGTTKQGNQCKRKVQNGQYCFNHIKEDEKIKGEKKGEKKENKKENKKDKKNCFVCLKSVTKEQNVELKCNHLLHTNCMKMLKKPECMICHKQFNFKNQGINTDAIKKREDLLNSI